MMAIEPWLYNVWRLLRIDDPDASLMRQAIRLYHLEFSSNQAARYLRKYLAPLEESGSVRS